MSMAHAASSEELNQRDIEAQASSNPEEEPPKGKLPFLDSYLSLWIIMACGAGLGLGQSEVVLKALRATSIGTTNILVAIGLVLMIYPPLAKVRWGKMGEVLQEIRLLLLATLLNWVVGPLLMFVLSLAFFHHASPTFMAGLSLVGCARCIAMVLVWNELAGGDSEYCAAIVALNALLTILLYPPFALLYLLTLPQAIFGGGSVVDVTVSQIAVSVGIYLGLPLAAAVLTWAAFTTTKGTQWYTANVTPVLGRLTLPALLFTVLVLFTAQSRSMVHKAADVAYTALPLLLYFFAMFILAFKLAQLCGATYAQTVTLAFTAASNNFELALAVAVGSFGLQSDQSLVSVVGALCEIPTMLALVRIAQYFRTHLTFKEDDKGAGMEQVMKMEMNKQ